MIRRLLFSIIFCACASLVPAISVAAAPEKQRVPAKQTSAKISSQEKKKTPEKPAAGTAKNSQKQAAKPRISKTGEGTVSLAAGTPIFELPPSAPSDEQPYALNVVYFVPADMEPFPDYERRLSEILLSLQQFYGEQMTRCGYVGRTFGLSKSEDGTRVNIITIKGEQNRESYPYSGGLFPILKEMNAFFASEKCPLKKCPAKKCVHRKLSEHTLIILPSTTGDDMDPGGVPFYGAGKNCFALDYPAFDLKYRGKDDALGRLFTKWYGGMGHELGHGLNLPHNSGRVSEDKPLGTALLGYGNYTLGNAPTFLTAASCATLDTCQVFRTTKMPKTPAPRIEKLDELAIRFGEGGCSVSGVIPKKNRVAHVVVYYDKDGYQSVADDYDAESFVADFDREKNAFTLEIPVDEIHAGRTNAVEIRIHLINDDGSRSTFRYPFPDGTRDVFEPADTELAKIEPPAPLSKAEKKKRERQKKN